MTRLRKCLASVARAHLRLFEGHLVTHSTSELDMWSWVARQAYIHVMRYPSASISLSSVQGGCFEANQVLSHTTTGQWHGEDSDTKQRPSDYGHTYCGKSRALTTRLRSLHWPVSCALISRLFHSPT